MTDSEHLADRLAERASHVYDAGHFEAAAALYDRALALDPDHIDAISNRALLSIELGQVEAPEAFTLVLQQLVRATTRRPEEPLPLFALSQLYAHVGLYVDAIAFLTETIGIDPYDLAALHARAELYIEQNQLALAVTDIQTMLLHPISVLSFSDEERGGLYTRLASLLLASDQLAGAACAYDRALAIIPLGASAQRARAFFGLGICHHRNGDFNWALGAFTSAIEHEPKNALFREAHRSALEAVRGTDSTAALRRFRLPLDRALLWSRRAG